jgi:hypothetical protein
VCVFALTWLGAVGATAGCSGNVHGVEPVGGGVVPGDVSCGGCACYTRGDLGLCGVCLGECMYCSLDLFCPGDPCEGVCLDRQFAPVDCPASAPVGCPGPFCCPSDHPACCPDGTCGEDATDCF